MNSTTTVTQKQLTEFLLNVAMFRPVFIWGPPGIGKSALVQDSPSSWAALRVTAGQPARARGPDRRAADLDGGAASARRA